MSKKSAAAVVDRLNLAYGAKSDNELSELLNIKRSTVGNWRSRDSIPYSICVTCSEAKGVTLDWLLTGQGPMRRGEGQQSAQSSELSPRETALLTLFNELSERDQREIHTAAEEKKRLNELEQRLARLEEAYGSEGKKLA